MKSSALIHSLLDTFSDLFYSLQLFGEGTNGARIVPCKNDKIYNCSYSYSHYLM